MSVSFRSLAQERARTGKGVFAPGLTAGKVIRDAQTMKRHARYVIELDASGKLLKHHENKSSSLDCIVVLAPVLFQGGKINQAVALEVGLSRFVPYAYAEFKSSNPKSKKQVQRIRPRTQIAVLPWETVRGLLPILWHAIQTCVDKRMETWTKASLIQDSGGIKGFKEYEAWLTIRIPKTQPLIHAILNLKSEEGKELPGKNYAYAAATIHRDIQLFRKLKSAYRGQYPDEVIKSSHVLQTVAGWMKKNIQHRGYTNRSMDAVRRLLEKHSTESLRIFDEVCRIFKVPAAPRNQHLDHCEQLLGQDKDTLVQTCTLRPCRIFKREKKRTKHAKECFTISIFGSKDHMERIHVRNINNRLNSNKPVDEHPLEIKTRPVITRSASNDDDDIPWDVMPANKTGTSDVAPF